MSEQANVEASARLTALVLRYIAERIDAGDCMTLAGEWWPERQLVDHARPTRKRHRRIYERGRAAANNDIVNALLWVANANDSAPAVAAGGGKAEQ